MNTLRHHRRLLLIPLLIAAAALALALRAGEQPATASSLPGGFAEAQVAHGFTRATTVTFTPDGRALVAEQGGKLKVVKNGAILPTPALTLPVDSSGERGLDGVTVDPSFATNGYIYCYYTATTPTTHNRVSRFTMAGDVADPATEKVLLDIDDLSSLNQHNAGDLKFGADGTLFIAVGDNQDQTNAQSMSTLKGKILRINRDGTIPSDNPFVSSTSGRLQAIYALGFRNPFTFDVQPGTGRIFVNDVGQDSWEEIDDVRAGGNYGWPATEGYTSDPAYVSPIFAYPHGSDDTSGCAITGGGFYNPSRARFPSDYTGRYFFLDFCNHWIHTLDPATKQVADFELGIANYPVSLTMGVDGTLSYLAVDADGLGSLYRVDYTGSLAPSIGSQPSDQLVSVGHPATFTVQASGNQPLSYQWYRDGAAISGATDASYTTAPLQMSDSGASFSVVVANSYGQATSRSAVVTMTTDQPPTPSIDSPVAGTTYAGGDVISFQGSASDQEDGQLPASAYDWRVDFGHHLAGTSNAHFHPFMPDTFGSMSGTFTVSTGGETDADVYYRIILTVTDSAGLKTTTYRDIMPRTSKVTLASAPTGMLLKLDGQPVTAPYTFSGVVGINRALDVYSPQSIGGIVYAFSSWSDGGGASHMISTPSSDTTFTATFNRVPRSGTMSASPNPIQVCDASGVGATTISWDDTGVTAVEVHLNSPTGATFAVAGSGPQARPTGAWVRDGMVFYLQDTSGGAPLTADNTLATVTVHLTQSGCPSGTISASPNPIPVCDGSGVGSTTLSWTSTDVTAVEVHVNSPTGATFAVAGPGPQTRPTGQWVSDGMVFYLQNTSSGSPGTTLGTVTAHLTTQGCPVSGTISASPNPIQVCDGSGKGATTVTWSSTGTTAAEVHLGSPTGTTFAATGPGTQTRTTKPWVTDGMVFYLQNTSSGSPGTTLASVTVHLTTQGCPATGTISANPNPIQVCDRSGQGATTLTWQAQYASSVQVRINAPNGQLFSSMGPSLTSKQTGKWVSEGMVFYLQNTSNGLPLTAANTLATVTVHLTSQGCSSPASSRS